MLIRWKRSLALALSLLIGQAQAADQAWSPSPPRAEPSSTSSSSPAVSLGRPLRADQARSEESSTPPIPAAALGRPIPNKALAVPTAPTILDRQFQPTGFSNAPGTRLTVRGRGDDGEEVQPAATSSPRSGAVNPLFTWSQGQTADEMAPPPRLESGSGAVPPPSKVGDYFPFLHDTPAFGGGPVMPPGPGGGGPSLGVTGAYPGNELYVRAEALLWWLKGSPVPGLGALTGDTRSNTGVYGGTRVMAGYWFDDDHCWGIEGGFFVLGQNGQTRLVSSTGLNPLALPYANMDSTPGLEGFGPNFPIAGPSVVAGLNNVGSIQLKNQTQLYGYEANLRGVWCRGPCWFIDGLVGYRGLTMKENLDLTAMTSGVGLPAVPGAIAFPGLSQRTITDHFGTQNTFNGVQLGMIMEYRHGCWVFDLTGKLALGTTHQTANISGSTVDITALGATTALPTGFYAQQTNSGHFNHDVFSVVPELGVTVGYMFTERLRAFVGYNLLGWSSVARPGNQINPLINRNQIPMFGATSLPGPGSPPGPTFAFHDSTFWAHGIVLGVEWRY